MSHTRSPSCRYYHVDLGLHDPAGIARRFVVGIDALDHTSICEIGEEETAMATAYQAIEVSKEALRNAQEAARALRLYLDGQGVEISREEWK